MPVVDFRQVGLDAGCGSLGAALAATDVGDEIVGNEGQRSGDAEERDAYVRRMRGTENLEGEMMAKTIHASAFESMEQVEEFREGLGDTVGVVDLDRSFGIERSHHEGHSQAVVAMRGYGGTEKTVVLMAVDDHLVVCGGGLDTQLPELVGKAGGPVAFLVLEPLDAYDDAFSFRKDGQQEQRRVTQQERIG